MAGTKEGGKAAAATNKAKYGDDFYAMKFCKCERGKQLAALKETTE